MDASACKSQLSPTGITIKKQKIPSNTPKMNVRSHVASCTDISKEKWERLMAANNWNPVELRDNRYNQIVHMVSAANGAEDFYSTEVSSCDGRVCGDFRQFCHVER